MFKIEAEPAMASPIETSSFLMYDPGINRQIDVFMIAPNAVIIPFLDVGVSKAEAINLQWPAFQSSARYIPNNRFQVLSVQA